MSLVTRCTACGTLFKVVADQLKVSDGWVRCGQCGTVFDAQAHLVAPAPVPETPAPSVSPGPADPSAAASPVKSTPSPLIARRGQDEADADADSLFQPGKLRDSAMLDSEIGPSSSTWVDSSLPNELEHLAEDLPDAGQAEPAPAAATAAGQAATGTASPEQETPGFIRQAQARQRWRSPAVRWALSLLCLLLLGGLAAQVLWVEKVRIAAQWPQSRAWLTSYCQALGCQVRPYQRIDAIAVDASSFNRINKNNPQLEASVQSYRLSISLKNNGTLAVAVPHVELSLQDAQDQLVLRRVLSPSDLGINSLELAAGQDLTASATLQLSTPALAGRRVQGYRVLAFYP